MASPPDDRTTVLETQGPDATRRAGEALARAATPLPAGGLVVALHGELGAGKTVFVQGIARGIGVPASQPVVSPTFTVARDYVAVRPADGGAPERVALHHVDAYRLRGAEDLESAGFEEMWGGGRLTCVEWAERVEDAMPEDRLEVTIEHRGAGLPESRRVTVRATGPVSGRVAERFRRAVASVGAGS